MNNLYKHLQPEHPEDVVKIAEVLPFKLASYRDVEGLWEAFSREWGSSWLSVSENTLTEFKNWLQE